MSVGYIRKNTELKFNTFVGRDEEQMRGLKFGPNDLPRMEKKTELFQGRGSVPCILLPFCICLLVLIFF